MRMSNIVPTARTVTPPATTMKGRAGSALTSKWASPCARVTRRSRAPNCTSSLPCVFTLTIEPSPRTARVGPNAEAANICASAGGWSGNRQKSNPTSRPAASPVAQAQAGMRALPGVWAIRSRRPVSRASTAKLAAGNSCNSSKPRSTFATAVRWRGSAALQAAKAAARSGVNASSRSHSHATAAASITAASSEGNRS